MGYVILGCVISIMGALWGWWFLISSIREMPKGAREDNLPGYCFTIATAGMVCLIAHLPLAIYIYVLIEGGFIEYWR